MFKFSAHLNIYGACKDISDPFFVYSLMVFSENGEEKKFWWVFSFRSLDLHIFCSFNHLSSLETPIKTHFYLYYRGEKRPFRPFLHLCSYVGVSYVGVYPNNLRGEEIFYDFFTLFSVYAAKKSPSVDDFLWKTLLKLSN